MKVQHKTDILVVIIKQKVRVYGLVSVFDNAYHLAMKKIAQEIEKLCNTDSLHLDAIYKALKYRKLKKGEYLLREGRVCRHYYFLESGSVRLYYHKDANDFTVWIGTAGEIFTDLESYLNEQPSRINIEALEPSSVYFINKEESDRLATTSNEYNTVLRRTVEIAFVNLAKNVMSFQSDDATERYERLEKEKNWLMRFPLKYISSFLGVTQSSLSRLRSKR